MSWVFPSDISIFYFFEFVFFFLVLVDVILNGNSLHRRYQRPYAEISQLTVHGVCGRINANRHASVSTGSRIRSRQTEYTEFGCAVLDGHAGAWSWRTVFHIGKPAQTFGYIEASIGLWWRQTNVRNTNCGSGKWRLWSFRKLFLYFKFELCYVMMVGSR